MKDYYLEANKLWSMSASDFNKWRRENDLLVLLQFFKEKIPEFLRWQEAFSITDEEFLGTNSPSRFFYGSQEQYLHLGPKRNPIDPPELYISHESSEEIYSSWSQHPDVAQSLRPKKSKGFVPFLHWREKIVGTHFIVIKKNDTIQHYSDLTCTGYEANRMQGSKMAGSSAILFNEIKLLKLGEFSVDAARLNGRNLDFVDLDGLSVTGGLVQSCDTVGYSSCKDLSFDDVHLYFARFIGSAIGGLKMTNCHVQNLKFDSCDMFAKMPSGPILDWSESEFTNVTFFDSVPSSIRMQRCELNAFTVRIESKRIAYRLIADFFRALRSAFQGIGKRHEASDFYYSERYFELLTTIFPLTPSHWNNYFQLKAECRLGITNSNVFWKVVLADISRNLKVFYDGKCAFQYLFRMCRASLLALEWAVYGFGERPGRVFIWMFFALASFAAKYYYFHPKLKGNVLESISCSAFNFATMGCNDKTGIDSLEGVMGAILIGLMVAGFTNRTKY